jgi:hypothetical protein
MLRALVAALLVANGLFFLWTQGWLDGIVGVRARGDREPERLAAQVRPESVVILARPPVPAVAARSAVAASAAVAAAPACLEAGPFEAPEVAAAETALRAAVPGAVWNTVRTEKPALWLVYMGAYPDAETLQRKQQELYRMRDSLEEIALPAEGPYGLSLGRFASRGAAERALAQWQERGIRTARVVQASPAATQQWLRVERADPALAAQLVALRAGPLGKGFAPCDAGEAARPRRAEALELAASGSAAR